MHRAHRIRLNPTPEQEAYFWANAHVARFAWNWALAEYNNATARGEKPNVLALKKELTRKRKEEGFAPWLAEVQSYAYQYAFQDLGAAISRYFDLKRKGKLETPKDWKGRKDGKPYGWPRFKPRHKTTPAFGVANTGLKVDGHSVIFSRCPGVVNMAETLRFEGKIMSGRVTRTGGHWYMAIAVEMEDPAPLETTGAVGIDLGIKYRAVTSDGQITENLRAFADAQRKMAKLQRSADRMWKMNGKQPTANWRKKQAEIAKLHKRIADLRREQAHELTTAIAQQYAVVGVEDLNIKGMVQNKKLAKAVSDAAMYQVREQLTYKVKAAGGKLVVVDRWFASTKRCSQCRETVPALSLSVRKWVCPNCGAQHDRDGNAAVNIRDEAIRIAGAA